jgi:ferritin
MKIGKTVQDAINEQIKNELFSGYIYLAMSAYFEDAGLPGFAHWMRAQATEEQEHAMKFFNFIYDRGGRVELQAIDKPPFEWASPLAAFEHALEHEQKVTGLIHDLYALAGKENDYATQVMLHWFIDEQVEEEKSASEIVDQLKMVEAKGSGLMVMDHHLGSRSED